MIDSRTKLTVFHDDNSSFVDYSDLAVDYMRDPFTVTVVSAEDYLYFGYSKPFNATYVELDSPGSISNEYTIELYDGSGWATVDARDETQGMTRSGFITWEKGDMNAVEVNSVSAYYIRLKPSVDQGSTTIRGINLVFSDDQQMKQEFFEITNTSLLPNGENSQITKHVASRNAIMQMLRNQGYVKVNGSTGEENINQWDLHDITEIRQAATFMALSKIFFNLSDSVDDNWWHKYREYQSKFSTMFALAKLKLDDDDDGAVDEVEKKAFQIKTWNR